MFNGRRRGNVYGLWESVFIAYGGAEVHRQACRGPSFLFPVVGLLNHLVHAKTTGIENPPDYLLQRAHDYFSALSTGSRRVETCRMSRAAILVTRRAGMDPRQIHALRRNCVDVESRGRQTWWRRRRQIVGPSRQICADLMSTQSAAASRQASADVSPSRQAGFKLTAPRNAVNLVDSPQHGIIKTSAKELSTRAADKVAMMWFIGAWNRIPTSYHRN
ncbi:hypothetical protein C8R43DRAFT_942723 [Mycena crocata]|nr:hypothetical protein C8R43DRAFT_961588 [Mycena crocata]KAJ7177454.1 hypothetical protein C8R43DRAFT_942723 [Mycena crocata]